MKWVQRAGASGALLSVCALGIALTPSAPAHAATQTQSYNLTINSQVVGPPPTTPPTIDSPTSGSSFDAKQIEVKGTCVTNLIVKIYRNALFAGSALCGMDGQYSLYIDLLEGRNDLVARQYDVANQASPDSDTVTVYYIPPTPVVPREDQPAPPPTTPSQTGASSGWAPSGGPAPYALLIDYEYSLQAIFPGESFRLPVKFTGGTAPYAVNIDWGDTKSDLFSRADAAQFDADHTYSSPGFHIVKIHVSDKAGQQASLQFVLIVNGSATEALISRVINDPDMVWVRAAGGAALVVSWAAAFAAGSAFEFRRLKRFLRRKK